MNQWDFTSRHEGVVPHLYKDTRNNITCGVGSLVPNVAELRKLPWSPSVQAAEFDWLLVRAAAPGKSPKFYRDLGLKARLSPDAMRRMFDEHVTAFRRAIDPMWHLAMQPEPVQIALVDMAFNLGSGGLARYKKLHSAVMARQWVVAADECVRGGIGAQRNVETRQLFLRAIEEV